MLTVLFTPAALLFGIIIPCIPAVSAVLIIVMGVVISLARYVYDYTRNYILEAKGFYFTSTTMSSLGTSHNISN